MVTKEDIERFLDRLAADEGGSYSEVEPGLWIARPSGELDFSVVVNYSPPVVLLRVKVMTLPTNTEALATLSRRLLELNATDLVHGSYGIENDSIVMTEALELSHLDYEEFQAALSIFHVGLITQSLLVGDRRGDLLFRFRQLPSHVDEDLVEHLLGIFRPRDQVVDVRP
jgi:hypothetical protein